MSNATRNVLFLCTGNSARSILGEALMTRLGAPRFRGLSAGSRPTGQPNPFALRLLRDTGHDLRGLRSKSWDEFARPDAPRLDIVLTVCGSAAGETCPICPGHPISAHWGLPDPAAVTGSEADIAAAFAATYAALEARITRLLALPVADMPAPDLRAALNEIGQMEGAA